MRDAEDSPEPRRAETPDTDLLLSSPELKTDLPLSSVEDDEGRVRWVTVAVARVGGLLNVEPEPAVLVPGAVLLAVLVVAGFADVVEARLAGDPVALGAPVFLTTVLLTTFVPGFSCAAAAAGASDWSSDGSDFTVEPFVSAAPEPLRSCSLGEAGVSAGEAIGGWIEQRGIKREEDDVRTREQDVKKRRITVLAKKEK